jgi:ComF family protein
MLCLYEIPLTRSWETKDNAIEKMFWGKVHLERACALYHFRKGSDYRPIIHKLKYHGRYEIGSRLGEELGLYLSKSELYQDIDMLVPIPIHPEKEKQRGYNQSAFIAAGMASVMNLPVETKNLIRTRYTETQTRKNIIDRWENVQSIFAVRDPAVFNGKHIMIIDDIITTGATIESCALTIQNQCSCKISVAAIGQASR